MEQTAFCSVIFPANLIYLSDFLDSLEAQTDPNFEVLLFNDGVPNLNDFIKNRTLRLKIITMEGSIFEVRKKLFAYLKESNFEKIIFGDTDDYFSENRVEDCKKSLDMFDVLANDLILVDKDKKYISGPYWANRAELYNTITIESIKKYNFFGLGNTAIRQKTLPNEIDFDTSLVALDWYFFSILLKNNWKAGFTSNSFTYYRQHNANTIGRKEMTFEDFKKGFNVKLNHYISLAKKYSEFEEIALKFKINKEKISEVSYKKAVENNIILNPFWWEEIQL